jgi:hypothetical protein
MLFRSAIFSFLTQALVATFWMGSLPSAAETKPSLTVDLVATGMPADQPEESSYKTCPYQYLGYRSVQWLDTQRILVAFNTSPYCALKEGIQAGTLRLIVFDLNGNLLHSADVSYDAGAGLGVLLIAHDGIWIGPNQTVIVEIPGSHLKAQPSSRDKVLVLSSELSPEQEIDTDSHQTYYDGIHFAGVGADRHAVLFWSSDGGIGHDRKCLLFSGMPLKPDGACTPQDLDELDPSVQYQRPALLPKGYQIRAFAGSSMDGGRVTLFGVKEGGLLGGCDLFGKLCPSHGILITFETATNQLIFKMKLPLSGRAAISPSGKHLALLQNNRLEIFPLP